MSSMTSTHADTDVRTAGGSLTLIELLRSQALRRPDRPAYTFLVDGETEELNLTYGELDARARAIAARLQSMNVGGGRVLLLYPPGLDYIAAFWGCLYAGAVAVPAYPPRQNRNFLRLRTIVADAEATFALTTSAMLPKLQSAFTQAASADALRWLATDELPLGLAEEWRDPEVGPDTLAFLQYTSGSTNAPKGVMVSHGNLIHNEGMIRQAFQQTEDSIIVGWLPLYHDMGLIGNVLQPAYLGARCILMSPLAFLQRPARWLEAISRYRATTSGGPNFAYDLCARKVSPEERAALDLSSWGVAFNGAEPVRAETIERFTEAFSPCGFRREALQPCYGLAEATLIVSGSSEVRQPVIRTVSKRALENNRAEDETADGEELRTLVGCGGALAEEKIIVVDAETLTERARGEVGEIWVSSQSVAGGYWNRPAETAETFDARLADTGEGPFLRTGDLGFLHEGELFVTGRLKDLIIIRGLNHYPQDIELTAERAHASLRPGGGAAFSVLSEGEERLVVVQEIDRRRQTDGEEAVAAVRRAVSEEHDLLTHAVVLVRAGSIPKTSSGKIQRRLCRTMFLENALDAVAEWRATDAARGEWESAAPSEASAAGESPIEFESFGETSRADAEGVRNWLRSLLASKLKMAVAEVGVDQPISQYGVDSLLAVELMHAVEERLGVCLSLADFLRSPSIAELTAQALELAAAGAREQTSLTPFTAAADAQPLSHGQQALWFLYQLDPRSAAYNIASAVRVLSPLDGDALRRALQALVNRHGALRTTFGAPRHGEPAQRVHDKAEAAFFEEDATRWSERQLRERLAEEAHTPFDLEAGPVLRTHLFRRSAQEQVLLVVVHHIVADFWSLAVLMQELGALYEAEASGARAELAPLKLSYGDYVRWQRELVEGGEGERHWEYWRENLGGELPALNLPTDRPRPPVQTYRGASHAFRLDAELTSQLKALGREQGTTLYVTLLATFHALLARYTGQDDVIVGSPTAGRNRAEFAGLVGYFVNPVAIRAGLAGDPTFEEFLRRVRRTVLDAFEHQDYPLAQLVKRIQPERDAGRSPLFQVMFVWQKAQASGAGSLAAFALGETGARARLGGLPVESLAIEQRFAQFDLTLAMAEAGDEITASLEYNSDLFEAESVARIATHFRTLLASAVGDPAGRVADLQLLSGEEREQLREWNRAATVSGDACLHELFEAQVERTPDAEALISGGERITYRELDERANRLARHLRELGVGPESLVGVLLERSAEMVVTLLAVLKSGAAYLPLDAKYPQDRLSFMLEDGGAGVVVTQTALAALVTESGARLVVLDEKSDEIARQSAAAFGGGARPDNLAYVIYTSGSTGRPKGVAIAHRSAAVLCAWARTVYTADQTRGVLASTSICFDLSVFELFVPLSRGGKIVLADDALHLPLLSAADEVTLVNTVPSAMAELLRMGGLPASARTVNLAGEPLKNSLAQQIYEQTQAAQVWNLYGPSEDTTYSTYALAVRGSTQEPTIGRPVANTRAHLLDANLRQVPAGAVGEIYLGGDGLARGYLGRPELTAERFIPDPFGAEPGARMYRTGDLGRYLPGGEIEFLGRADHQVKVRGFRIELGEVEAELARHGGIRECVVVAREEAGGDKRLVAYLVAEAGGVLDEAELRRALKERLPDYMIPSVFVVLEEMPLTPNGKINRQALPAPDPSRSETAEGFVAPRTPVEERLAEIWGEVLGLARVGVHDNFFDLGGHSLLATRVISRVREAFAIDVPLHALFQAATVGQFAARVEQERNAGRHVAAGPLAPVARDGELPLSFAQQRLWFLEQLEPGATTYHIPAAVRLSGALDVEALGRTLSEIVRRHEALRTVFESADGRPLQQIMHATPVEIPLVDLSALGDAEREAEASRLSNEEAARPFDLARGPLMRARLLRLDGREHLLLLTMHHIVSDGWSLGVLLREMTELYRAFLSGEPSPLAELPIQYADFATWQRETLRGELLEGQLDYWKKQLGGRVPVLELPGMKQRPAVQSFRGAVEKLELSPELSAQLEALSRREGATLFMTLLTAFQTLLHRYTGQPDIAVGTPTAGRTRLETESLIGFFVNTLVLRGSFDGDPTFAEALGRVRETTLEAHAHQDVPFETLVETLQPERSLSHSPLFQVMFVWQNTSSLAAEWPGVSVKPAPFESTTAKFDLTLFMEESAGGLSAAFEYNRDLFDAESVRRMAGHFCTLLTSAVGDPAGRVAELRLLTEREREQLREWNRAATVSGDACLHELFEAQALRTPEAEALVFGDERVTYRELDERANRLARHLRGMGVGPESLVGVLLERSTEMVVTLLAVLKAGAAYLPLDAKYPADRLSFMLADGRAEVVVTQKALAALVTESGAGRRLVVLDEERDEIARQSAAAFDGGARPSNLAYVIYTSGSTGRPKGVAIAHRSASILCAWARTVYTADQTRGVLASTSICFDLSVFELFVPLSRGGKIVLADDALHLPTLAAASETTLINTVPSAMAELLRSGGVPASVRTVNLAGEPLKGALVEDIYGGTQATQVWNLYGPSEDTTYSTYALVGRGEGREPTIGRPVANTQAHLLDGRLRPVPVGAVGEIYLGGDGLARGYLNRPELTAERFIPDPFGAEPGARMYRTGDLGRYLPGSEIEFLGRADHQVKVRGFRIELGEVEAELVRHPAAREAVVVAGDDERGDKRLVAYVVADGQQPAPTTSEWRQHLQQKLPDYMIPAVFVVLEEMPLTPNGKVDRKRLPAPDEQRPQLADAFVAPRTAEEEALAGIWREVLGVERVGVHDNFFDLGGHSLLATQLVSRVEKTFRVKLSLRRLFETPTIAELAQLITENAGQQTAAYSPPKITPRRRAGQSLDELLTSLDHLPEHEAKRILEERSSR